MDKNSLQEQKELTEEQQMLWKIQTKATTRHGEKVIIEM